MKVLIVTTYFPQTSETFILSHAIGLIKNGLKVSLISMFTASNQVVHEEFKRYHLAEQIHNERPSNINRLLSAFIQLQQAVYALFHHPKSFFSLLKDHTINQKRTYFGAFKLKKVYQEADLIHAHFGNVGLRMTNLKRIGIIAKNTPIVCSFHGSDIDEPFYRRRPHFYQRFFTQAALVISNSEYLKNRLLENGCPETKIAIIKNGINLQQFFAASERDKTTHNNVFTLLTVARLTEFKGIIYGIKAIKLLTDAGFKNLQYLIIGDGELRDMLKETIEDLDLTDFVKLLGMKPQEEIIQHYQKAAIFILPGIISKQGRAETQGIVLQEAQAMGLPVITTSVGGISEGVINEKTGFIVAPKNPQQIADKIKLLLENEPLRLTMGQAAMAYIKANYNQEQLIEKIINHYKKLAA